MPSFFRTPLQAELRSGILSIRTNATRMEDGRKCIPNERSTSFYPRFLEKELTSMKKLTGVAAACLLAVAGVALAADELKSGLPVGESVPPFNVRDITGPNEGKTLCYRCAYGATPVVTIFTRE